MLSCAFSCSAFAALAMSADVLGRVVIGEPGFIGRGGGARSGSELSHLRGQSIGISDLCSTCGTGIVLNYLRHTWEYGQSLGRLTRKNVDVEQVLGLESHSGHSMALCESVTRGDQNRYRPNVEFEERSSPGASLLEYSGVNVVQDASAFQRAWYIMLRSTVMCSCVRV
jgi:hypothetical protein